MVLLSLGVDQWGFVRLTDLFLDLLLFLRHVRCLLGSNCQHLLPSPYPSVRVEGAKVFALGVVWRGIVHEVHRRVGFSFRSHVIDHLVTRLEILGCTMLVAYLSGAAAHLGHCAARLHFDTLLLAYVPGTSLLDEVVVRESQCCCLKVTRIVFTLRRLNLISIIPCQVVWHLRIFGSSCREMLFLLLVG